MGHRLAVCAADCLTGRAGINNGRCIHSAGRLDLTGSATGFSRLAISGKISVLLGITITGITAVAVLWWPGTLTYEPLLGQRQQTLRLEQDYARRIEKILTPVVGMGKVRVQVSAEVNYSLAGKTRKPVDLNPKVTRLSIAVVIDQLTTVDTNGIPVKHLLSPQEQDHLQSLVKQATGFTPSRGDTMTLVNTPFSLPLEPVPLWQQPRIQHIARLVAIGLLLLLLIGVLVRLLIKALGHQQTAEPGIPPGHEQQVAEATGALHATLNGVAAQTLEVPGTGYELQLALARKMVRDDPKRVAQVVRAWIQEHD